MIGAVITPLAIDFIWAKLEGSAGEAPQQLPPAQAAPQLPPAQAYPAPYGAPRGYGYATRAYSSQGYGQPTYQTGQGYAAQPGRPPSPPGYAPQTATYTPGRGYRR